MAIAPETPPEETLITLNKGIEDLIFIFTCAQQALTRVLELRQTLSKLDDTERSFHTLTSLRVEFDRQQNLIEVLLSEVRSRRNQSFRDVEVKTKGKPPIVPPGHGGQNPGQGQGQGRS